MAGVHDDGNAPRSPTTVVKGLSSSMRLSSENNKQRSDNFSVSYHTGSRFDSHQQKSGHHFQRDPLCSGPAPSGQRSAVEHTDENGARPKDLNTPTSRSIGKNTGTQRKMEDLPESCGTGHEQGLEWPDHLEIPIMMRFRLPMGEKLDIPQSITKNIPVSFTTYLKWKLIERCPILIPKIKNILSKSNVDITFPEEMEHEVLTFPDRNFPADISHFLQSAVEELKDIHVLKPIELPKDEASQLQQKLKLMNFVHNKYTHTEVLHETKVCVVCYGTSSREEATGEVNKFLKHTRSSLEGNISTAFEQPAYVGKVFSYFQIIKSCKLEHPQVTFKEGVHGEKYLLTLTGSSKSMTEAGLCVSKLFYIVADNGKCVHLRSDCKPLLKELSLEKNIQQHLDDGKFKCVVVQTQENIYLYGMDNNQVKNAAIEVGKIVCMKQILLTGEWRSNANKIMKDVQDKFSGPYVLNLTEGAKLCIVGLDPAVTRMEEYIKGLLNDRRSGSRVQASGRHPETVSKSLIVRPQEVIPVRQFVQEVVEKYRIRVVENKDNRNRETQLPEFMLTGEESVVNKAIKELERFRESLVSDIFSLRNGSDAVRKFFTGSDGIRLIKDLESKLSVGICHADISSGNTSKGKGLPDVIMHCHGNDKSWQFPYGYGLKISPGLVSSHGVNVEALLKIEAGDNEPRISKPVRKESSTEVTVTLPRWSGGSKDEVRTFECTIKKLLEKVDEESKESLGIRVCQPFGWSKHLFLDCLLQPIMKHMTDNIGQPKYIVLCFDDEETLLKAVKSIPELLQASTGASNMTDTRMQVKVIEGKLHETKVDVLVNTTAQNLNLNHGKVSNTILMAAGMEIQTECHHKYPGGLRHREIAVTKGYNLHCQKVFHGSLQKYNRHKEMECIEDLRHLLNSCLNEADQQGFHSIAFPAIGSGNLQYPVTWVASEMFTVTERWKREHSLSSLQQVYFVIYPLDTATLKEFRKIEADMIRIPLRGQDVSDLKICGTWENVVKVKKELEDKVDTLMIERQQIAGVSRTAYTALRHFFDKELRKVTTEKNVKMEIKDGSIILEGKPEVVNLTFPKVQEYVQQVQNMKQLCKNIERATSNVQSVVERFNRRYYQVCCVFDPIRTVLNFFSETKDDLDKVSQMLLKEIQLEESDKTTKQQRAETEAESGGMAKEESQPADKCTTWGASKLSQVSGQEQESDTQKSGQEFQHEQKRDMRRANDNGDDRHIKQPDVYDAEKGKETFGNGGRDAAEGGGKSATERGHNSALQGTNISSTGQGDCNLREKGNDLGGRKQDVLASEKKGMSVAKVKPSFIEDKKLKCTFTKCFVVKVFTGKILDQNKIDTVVCSEDQSGKAAGMIARELLRKAGPQYKEEKHAAFQNPPHAGEVVTTRGGQSGFKNVIHALIPMNRSASNVERLYLNVFEEAVNLGSSSLAISLLATGVGKEDPKVAGKILYDSCSKFSQIHTGHPLVVHVVNIDAMKTKYVADVFKEAINEEGLDLPHPPLQLIPKSSLPSSFTPSTGDVSRMQGSKEANSVASMKKMPATTAAAMHDDDSNDDDDDSNHSDYVETCVICMDNLKSPKTLRCRHTFCEECITAYFKVKQACPTCGQVCGVIFGDQPDGYLEISKIPHQLAGYVGTGCIKMCYFFPDGHQEPNHPQPGAAYRGIKRVAYLPDTDEGRRICAMMKVAFERRLIFTIGHSRTTGKDGVITWNDIHQKTDPRPNTQFGYPDASYLTRVKEELSAKGVTEKDAEQGFLIDLSGKVDFRKMIDVTKKVMIR